MMAPVPHQPLVVSPAEIILAAVLLVAVLLGCRGHYVLPCAKFLRGGPRQIPGGVEVRPTPDMENASAFMAASMQGVIEKLRTQEKELARLHLLAQERAQESERLTEEVRATCPPGCCW